jgi:CheY-like chemotaxis protein
MALKSSVGKFQSTKLLIAGMKREKVDIRRILIIDDEEDIREIAQLSLEELRGWEVVTAESGIEGLAKAKIEQPDAILLDITMPDMDGFSTWLGLRTNPVTVHIPVIFVTAKAQTINWSRCAEMGMNAVIAKPFDPMTLADRVAEILGWH